MQKMIAGTAVAPSNVQELIEAEYWA